MNLSRLFAPVALVSAIALSGISGSALADTTLRIGVTPVPHADIVNFVKPALEKEGVKLEVVEFNDYIQPNLALDAGELDDVTAAVINANYALEAGFNPAKNAIALEEKSSPFGNVVAIREGDDKKESFQKFKKAITSPEVKKFIEEKYQGGVLPVF